MNRIIWSKKKATIALILIAIIAVSSVMFLQKSQTTQAAIINPHPGLVGWWRFDEGSGTIAGDSSGNGNNGTLQGSPLPSWVAGKYGDALSFNGVNDYLQIPQTASLVMTNTLTISAWVYPASFGRQVVFAKAGSNDGYALFLQQGTLEAVIGNGASFIDQEFPYSFQLNTWYYIVITYDGQNMKGYVNGAQVGSVTQTTTIVDYSSAPIIGAWSQGLGNWFNGIIDEAQIYNRALSAAEIQTNYQQAPDFSPYLLANLPQGTTQVITTLSWQGTGNINVTITTPSQTYTESMMSKYQKTTYSTTSGGPLSMLNIKRLSISVNALPSAQSWNITLTYDTSANAYQISVETQ